MIESSIGFVGTGAMGSAIAQRLLQLGYSVTVHNRTRANASSVVQAGASWAETPAEVAQRCSIVVTCLRDSNAVDLVYRGPAGLLSAAKAGQIFIEHGTFAPRTAELIEAEASSRYARFLAIPVSGGPVGAASGRLTAMAGGDESALRQAQALLRAYTSHLTHVGTVTHGLVVKLVNQLLVTVHLAAAAEALALVERSGLSRSVAAPILMQGWAASAMLERTVRQLDGEALTSTGVTIDGLVEVQQLVADKLRETHSSNRIFEAARTLFADAAECGLGENDPACLLQIITSPIGDQVRKGGNSHA
ncbi:NAD(P)-dependent oxidoreductase [Nocardia sp. CY41]|uniref:NAD(P)-dependent oxidoreductase n=1 Tax=Nocardia sp. CY41 TaxID=2608686 RepID=UPI0022A722C5|nr:NAD(P)-dependent oxidoreductase [Nocardia sp. CY41]